MGYDTADDKADHGFNQTLHTDKSGDKQDRVGYTESGSNPLDIFCVIEKDTQKSHEKQGV